jgi:hypothetical protein
MRTGLYSDGSRVNIHGERNGFIYITFVDGSNKGITTKVPESWVTEDDYTDLNLYDESLPLDY